MAAKSVKNMKTLRKPASKEKDKKQTSDYSIYKLFYKDLSDDEYREFCEIARSEHCSLHTMVVNSIKLALRLELDYPTNLWTITKSENRAAPPTITFDEEKNTINDKDVIKESHVVCECCGCLWSQDITSKCPLCELKKETYRITNLLKQF